MSDLRTMSGEQLRKEAKRADAKLADEIVRIRATDEPFREVLERSLAVEAEQMRRRKS